MNNIEPAVRAAIFEALGELARRHRAYQAAPWALPSVELDEIESIAAELTPSDPAVQSRFLFDDALPDLPDLRKSASGEYQVELSRRREMAANAMYTASGPEGIFEFARLVKDPMAVGWSLAYVVGVVDERVLSRLDDPDLALVNTAYGYARRKMLLGEGAEWLQEMLTALTAQPHAQARLLRASPDLPDAWRRAAELGTEVEESYWREFVIAGLGHDFGMVNETSRQLLAHGRVGAAVDLLSMYVDSPTASPDVAVVCDALNALAEGGPGPSSHISPYEIQHLLTFLRSANTLDEDQLGALEWRLLPGLGYETSSPTLERLLARDPAFFAEVLSICFKRKDGTSDREVMPENAINAYRLLEDWRVIPGSTARGGDVDIEVLQAWLATAHELLDGLDRTDVGDRYIGHVFAHAKEDADGTWPTRAVRDAMEGAARDKIDHGFRMETLNQRGVTTRGLADGGKQEFEQAEHFDTLAGLVENGWPRTAQNLRLIAAAYRELGIAEDEEARLFIQGLDT